MSLQGSYEVRRVDLSSGFPVPGAHVALPPGYYDDLAFAGPMVVLPGTTGSLAVSLHYEGLSPSYAGTVILDDGVLRPEQTDGHTGASRLTGGPPGWMFGYNDLHTGFGFYALRVTPDGVHATEHEGLISGFYTDIVHANDRVYATSGEVVDVSDPASPSRAGSFAFAGESVLPLDAPSRLLMLSSDYSEPPTLRLLDTETFAQVDAIEFDLEHPEVSRLVSTNGSTLAFIARDGFFDDPSQIVVMPNPFND
ncbi:hypothetical protein [Chondromyces apiculatus]|uniref:Uncharacterized protein n=1 Tax=Chondromyces apiculatus DSM 436 TaxID=1192034 RepID=A0A017TBU2_9BACT|nr:hypothetical protein [Chondromyces apiculatus]EYF06392.1 Hypothetical protein CAP_1922 [Chondromyces apiculatus DSM 436]